MDEPKALAANLEIDTARDDHVEDVLDGDVDLQGSLRGRLSAEQTCWPSIKVGHLILIVVVKLLMVVAVSWYELVQKATHVPQSRRSLALTKHTSFHQR